MNKFFILVFLIPFICLAEIFEEEPADFNSKKSVAGCLCEYEDKILLLQTAQWKPNAGLWGIPLGKIQNNEIHQYGAIRILKKLTGLKIDPLEIVYVGQLYSRQRDEDYIIQLFRVRLHQIPTLLKLDRVEYQDSQWLTLKEANEKPLIANEAEVIHFINTRKKLPLGMTYQKELEEGLNPLQ